MLTSPDIASMRLLVTGATGFIGSRLALHAKECGIDVLATGRVALDMEASRAKELEAAGVALEIGSLQESVMQRLLAGRDTVIHLAAAQHESQMPESYFRAVNVDLTRDLLDVCEDAGVQRFVYGSTMGVYGGCLPGENRDAADVLDESSPVHPDNPYTRSKIAAEELVLAHARRMEACIIRIAETYGPGDWRLLKLFRAIERGQFYMIGGGENRRQCIHVSDLVRGLLLACQRSDVAGETFIFAGNEILTTNQMVLRIAHALDRKLPQLRLPAWPFVAAANVMERTLPLLHIRPPLHRRRLDFFLRSFVFSTTKAQQRLGFRPEIDFQAGVQDTAHWYRSNGLLGSRRDEITHTLSV